MSQRLVAYVVRAKLHFAMLVTDLFRVFREVKGPPFSLSSPTALLMLCKMVSIYQRRLLSFLRRLQSKRYDHT